MKPDFAAYVKLSYADDATVLMPNSPPVQGRAAMTDTGKCLEVWKQSADGASKASNDSWSSDLPLPGLTIPTGPMAADARPEIRKLADIR